MYVQSQLNSGLTQADVVIATTAPSGSPFTATDAAVSPEFFYAPSEQEIYRSYLSWRIFLQVCDMQLEEYGLATNGDRTLWAERILETLQHINALAEKFKPSRFPCDIKPATAGSAVLSASGGNWCDAMTVSLSMIFLNVPNAGISRID